MSEHEKSLLVVRYEERLSMENMNRLQSLLKPIAEQIGAIAMVVDDGLDVGIHSDIRPLLEEQLTEQRKISQLLTLLIDALTEEDIARSDEPLRYMDGTLVECQPAAGGASNPPGDE